MKHGLIVFKIGCHLKMDTILNRNIISDFSTIKHAIGLFHIGNFTHLPREADVLEILYTMKLLISILSEFD